MRRDYEREQLRRAYQQNEDADGALYIPAREKTDIFAEGRLFRVCAYIRGNKIWDTINKEKALPRFASNSRIRKVVSLAYRPIYWL